MFSNINEVAFSALARCDICWVALMGLEQIMIYPLGVLCFFCLFVICKSLPCDFSTVVLAVEEAD